MAPGKAKGMLAVLLCVHCSLTFLVAVGGLLLAGAGAPLLFGMRLELVLVPVLGLTGFVGWLWWGRRAAEAACEVPEAPSGPAPSAVGGPPAAADARGR